MLVLVDVAMFIAYFLVTGEQKVSRYSINVTNLMLPVFMIAVAHRLHRRHTTFLLSGKSSDSMSGQHFD
jgi:hypothetical protein